MPAGLGITFPPVPGGIYGTGEEQNVTNGVPVPANFLGQTGWWNPPTNWFVKWVDGQAFVSPTSDFSKWIFACKINYDGAFVFQCHALNRFGLPDFNNLQ
jgi:hypothetical protein